MSHQFALTIYLLSGWLASRFPGLDLLSHDAGHLWYTVLGFEGDAVRRSFTPGKGEVP